jgi:hypothetical protein
MRYGLRDLRDLNRMNAEVTIQFPSLNNEEAKFQLDLNAGAVG